VTNTLSKWTKTYFLLLALAFGRVLYESKNSRSEKTEAMHEEVEHMANEPLLILGAVFALVFYVEIVLSRAEIVNIQEFGIYRKLSGLIQY